MENYHNHQRWSSIKKKLNIIFISYSNYRSLSKQNSKSKLTFIINFHLFFRNNTISESKIPNLQPTKHRVEKKHDLDNNLTHAIEHTTHLKFEKKPGNIFLRDNAQHYVNSEPRGTLQFLEMQLRAMAAVVATPPAPIARSDWAADANGSRARMAAGQWRAAANMASSRSDLKCTQMACSGRIARESSRQRRRSGKRRPWGWRWRWLRWKRALLLFLGSSLRGFL